MRLPAGCTVDPARVQQLKTEADALRTDPEAAAAQRRRLTDLLERVGTRFTQAEQAGAQQ